MTRKTAGIVVAFICIFQFILSSHVFVVYTMDASANSTTQFCTVKERYAYLENLTMPIIVFFTYTFLPSIIIIVCNTLILKKLWQRRKMKLSSKTDQAVFKIMPMLLLLSTVFVVSTFPPTIIFFLGESLL